MRFTLRWLKEHLDTDASLAAIVDKLTMIGLEVERVEDKAKELSAFTVAAVVAAEKHPNADKLKVCLVDTGSGAPVKVVCGAPNARAGMKGVFAPPGTRIPGTGLDLKVGKIRGVESHGMLVSAREMEISDDHQVKSALYTTEADLRRKGAWLEGVITDPDSESERQNRGVQHDDHQSRTP